MKETRKNFKRLPDALMTNIRRITMTIVLDGSGLTTSEASHDDHQTHYGRVRRILHRHGLRSLLHRRPGGWAMVRHRRAGAESPGQRGS